MEMFNKISDGEATQIAMDKILEMNTQADEDELPEKEYIETLTASAPFRDGINKRIAQLGYVDDLTDVSKRVDFLTAQFEKHEIEPISKATLKNWLSKTSPAGDSAGRENMFKLCFALEMDAAETAEFFLKAFLNRPFNYKNTNEAVYLHCLLSGKTYNDALRIIKAVDNIPQTVCADRDIETEQLGKEIAAIQDEEELISFLAEHRYAENEQHQTATKKIKELLEDCYVLASQETEYTKDKPMTVKSTDALLDIIYDFDSDSMEKQKLTIKMSKFTDAIKENWPHRQLLHNIEKHNVHKEDVYRKALVLLTFYKFYAYAYISQRKKMKECDINLSLYENQFEDQLESNLAKCGYVQLYKRNPFDWLMLYCAAFPNPLTQFRSVIAEFYLDEVDDSEDK